MKTHGYGWANGKIILMGEHAVVYGEPAIALPFTGTKVEVHIKPAETTQLISTYYQGPLSNSPDSLHSIHVLITKLLTHFDYQAGLSFTITSTIPAERGMGSSAAVAVAVTRAVFHFFDVPITHDLLLHFVNQAEKIAHGNPSGIDAAATSGKNPLYFIKGAPFEDFPLNIDAYLVVADTGIKGQTRAAVASVAQLRQTAPDTTIPALQQLGKLAKRARQTIIHNQPAQLGACMSNAHFLLQQLSVSNSCLDNLVDTALQAGALGAKLTGGGRGGCLIVLAENRLVADGIEQQLRLQGAKQTWVQGLGAYEHV